MEHLRYHDVQSLLTCVQELNTISDLAAFPAQAMAALHKLVPLRPSTVQTYVIRLYQKLGVETRAAATMLALEALGFVRLSSQDV